MYVGLLHQLEAEDTLKQGKDTGVRSALSKMKTNSFVVTLSGATDVYKREQILSQQCQKIDQHIFEVSYNLKQQIDKLETMLKELTDAKEFKDWTITDVEKLDGHLWENLKKTLTDIIKNEKFRGEELNDFHVRGRVTRQSRMTEFLTTEAGGICKPGIVKGLKEVKSYCNDLVEALKDRFEDDFKDPFIKEIKDVLDFNFMLDLENDIKQETKTYDGCLAQVKEHGNESLKKIVRRQNSESRLPQAEETKIENQYIKFKEFSFELIADINMTKDKKSIKSAAVTETAVCELCHRRFEFKDLVKHVKNQHKDQEAVNSLDQIKTYNSIKVLHGVCLQEKLYYGKQEFLNLALKLLCKTPNEAVVESMGSMLQKHMKTERNAAQSAFEGEMHIDWNGPVVAKADHLLNTSLDRKFGSRRHWHFKTGSTRFYTSEVVDRKKTEVSRLSFLNKTS